MQIFNKQTNIDFIGTRRIPVALSVVLVIATLFILFTRGLNFGLDFTGGTLVELHYAEPVQVAPIRKQLADAGLADTVVQHFGTSRDVMVRIPVDKDSKSSLSNQVVDILRQNENEQLVTSRPGKAQQCAGIGNKIVDCKIQVRRVEFVGPQVGEELTEQGGLAMLYTLIAVLVYVMFRFEWRFAVGAIIAISHDVILTFGFFSLLQLEFSLSVLAAILAVLGYSLNDTIVVFDRIRENFRKMRKATTPEIMNVSINQTLSRTIITSTTTLLTVLALFVLGGEIIRGFSIALMVGIVIGTYSSIYVATPTVLAMGVSREDLLPVKKEAADHDSML
ncbi:MAG: protein translocase subunit SecF [Acidiferrobacterales bacterium]